MNNYSYERQLVNQQLKYLISCPRSETYLQMENPKQMTSTSTNPKEKHANLRLSDKVKHLEVLKLNSYLSWFPFRHSTSRYTLCVDIPTLSECYKCKYP